MNDHTTRRQFLGHTAALAVAAAAAPATTRADGNSAGTMPMISVGKLKISRVILGSNPFFGWDHGNPQATKAEMLAVVRNIEASGYIVRVDGERAKILREAKPPDITIRHESCVTRKLPSSE